MRSQNFKFLFLFLFLFLISFSHIISAQDIRSYSYLPASERFFFDFKAMYQTEKQEIDRGNNDDQMIERRAAKSVFELGYSWSKHSTASFEWGHYFFDKINKVYGNQSHNYRGQHFENKKTWASDLRFNLYRRLEENFLGAPIRDLIFSYTPRLPSDLVNRGRENGHQFLGGLRFGVTDKLFDALGLFYVKYKYDTDRRRIEDDNIEKIDPHTSFGTRLNGQFNFYGPLALGAAGGIERETDYITHTPNGNEKTVKSWKYTYGGEFAYVGSNTLRGSFSVMREQTLSYILRLGNDDKVKGENTYYTLSVKSEF